MANNLQSYQRFTAQPSNISQYGSTVEEFAMQRGAPDPNPVHSPMANQAVTDVRLSLSLAGSDRTRLNSPIQPVINPYEGPRFNLVLTRSALKKLKGKALLDLQSAVEDAPDLSEDTKALMGDSIRRALIGLGEYLSESIGMTEGIYARCIATSKG